ncbi:MAG: prepilin-type N-terminal cleavage/methylation domain-containing protein [Elusimicrobiota bacterium]
MNGIRGQSGYTLVETMVAILLVSFVVTSVFSVVLTARMGAHKTGVRGQALYFVRQSMERLKAYVSADTSAPGPTPNWTYPGDACNCYALAQGVHDITSTLPVSFRGAPRNGTLEYNVSNQACGGQMCQRVEFQIKWDE